MPAVATRREAAEHLHLHLDTLDRMVKRGEIAVVRYASRTMIPLTELNRLTTPAMKSGDTTDAAGDSQHEDIHATAEEKPYVYGSDADS